MQKKDLSKQQRRKRKDPQSRDFQCNCGKSYLSYAAAYTHVKNKHGGSKDFIKKPQKQKLKRGRPKDRKQIVISLETQSLSICEETTLLIFECLKDKKQSLSHHIILEGNQELNNTKFTTELQNLKKNYSGQNATNLQIELNIQRYKIDYEKYLTERDFKLIRDYICGVNKHFVGQIAAKVVYTMGLLAQKQIFQAHRQEYEHELSELIQVLKRPDLEDNDLIWYGEEKEILQILINHTNRWFQARKGHVESGSIRPSSVHEENDGQNSSSNSEQSSSSDDQLSSFKQLGENGESLSMEL